MSTPNVFFQSNSKRTTAEEQALAISSSFPTRVRQLMSRLVVHTYSCTSGPLAAECEKHSEAVNELRDLAIHGVESLRASLANVQDPDTVDEALRQIESSQTDKVEFSKRALSLAKAAVELATKVRDELIPKLADFQKFTQETKARIRSELEQIGSGPAENPLFLRNAAAAERAFEVQVVSFNSHVRGAIQSEAQVNGDLEAARAQVYQRTAALAEAQDLAHGLVLKAIVN